MRQLLTITFNDLRIMMQEKEFYINLVIVPVILAYVIGLASGSMGSPSGSDSTRFPIDVIDHDQSALSRQFLETLRTENELIVLCGVDEDQASICGSGEVALDAERAQSRLSAKQSLALIEIPAGFAQTLADGGDVSLVYRSHEDAMSPSYLLQSVQSAAQKTGSIVAASRVGGEFIMNFASLREDQAALTQSVADRAAAYLENSQLQIEVVSAATDERDTELTGTGFRQSIPGIGAMYVMFNIFPAMGTFIQERLGGTLQRLVVMPIQRAQILGGKMLARFLVGLIQFFVVVIFGLFLGVSLGNDPLAFVLIMVAYVACITALTLLLSTFIHNDNQASGVALFLALTLAPLGGSWWPLEIVPPFMRTIGHISPVAWAMDGFTSLTFHGGDLSTVLVPVGVLLAATVVFFAIGVMRFRYE